MTSVTPDATLEFRVMRPSVGAYGSRGVTNGVEQCVHNPTIMAASEAEADEYVKRVYGGSYFVVPVVDGKRYG